VKRREFITLLGGEVAEAEAQGLPMRSRAARGLADVLSLM
jgi:hypothetical protein